jgi:Tol biopolymer transport system component
MENATGWDLYTVNANGTGLTQRTNDATIEGDPDWSPSGTQIAYAKLSDIYIYDLSTNTETAMGLLGANKNRPKWSPNGAQLVFELSPSGADWEVAIVNANGTGQTNLSNDPTNDDLTPVWSPPIRNQIAWVKGGNILVHDLTTNTQSLLTSSGNASSPAFSPSGQYLVYVENGDIYRLTWTGSAWGNLTQLTNTGDNFSPCWTPNSQYIIYMSTQPSGDAEIWRMRFDGSQKVNLTNIGATDEAPVCQP